MMRAGFSRRRFLSTLAATGAATRLSPFVPASVRAQGAAVPKRLITIFSPMGYLENSFWPTGTETDFQLGETMKALEPYKNKLIYADGLLLYGAQWYYPDDDNEHASGQSMIFTGAKKDVFATGPSIDQAVASHLYDQNKTRLKSLTLGVNSGTPTPHASCFFSAAQAPTTPQMSPSAVFDSYFKDFMQPMVDTTAADRLKRQKQSVIDLVKGDLDRICKAAGAEDRRKCEAHLDGIRVLEDRLKVDAGGGGAVSAACKPPTRLTGGTTDERIRAHMDLTVASLACDFTRSIAIQLGHCDGGLDPFNGLNHHSTTHDIGDKPGDQTTIANHKKFDAWFAGHWAYLIGKLTELKDADGSSMIDNTLILFGSDTTSGQTLGLGAHCHWRFPLWMAGGSNFAFKTGRYLKLNRPARADNMATDKQWPSTQRVLTSVGRAFGMNIDKFGNMDPGTGPLVGL